MTSKCDKGRAHVLQGAKISLRTLFAIMFGAACLSRLAARYGLGIFVLLTWAGCVGAAVGLVVAIVAGVAAVGVRFAATNRLIESTNLCRSALCVFAGALGGFLAEAIFLACAASLGAVRSVPVGELWTAEILSGAGRTTMSAASTVTVFVPAIVGAVANCFASIMRPMCTTSWRYIASVAATTAMVCGSAPVILLIIMISRLPKARGLEYEWFGLWPLAAILYFAIFAFIGAACGAVTAALWLWIDHARANAASRRALWCVSIIFVFLITEAALQGWVADAFRWANVN